MKSDRISPAAALRMVAKVAGDESKAKSAIRSWAALGKLSAQAQGLYAGLRGVLDAEVPATFWNALDSEDSDWVLGNFRNTNRNDRSMSVTAVLFSKAEVEELVAYLSPDAPPEENASVGGHMRKADVLP